MIDLRTLPSPEQRRAIRVNAGLTQAALADYLGVTLRTVQWWESGEHEPRGPRLAAYVRTLAALAEPKSKPEPVPEPPPLPGNLDAVMRDMRDLGFTWGGD